MSQVQIGVIGGSGLYNMEALTDIERMNVNTPFGDPSDDYIIGMLEGVRVAFLPGMGKDIASAIRIKFSSQHLRVQTTRSRTHSVCFSGWQLKRPYSPS
jgi:hypothetical protein